MKMINNICVFLCSVESFVYSEAFFSILKRIGREAAYDKFMKVRKSFANFCASQVEKEDNFTYLHSPENDNKIRFA